MLEDAETTLEPEADEAEDRDVSTPDTDQDEAQDGDDEAEDAEVSDDQSDEEAEDDAEKEAPTFTVKVDGKDVIVTLEELQSGYSRTADYTRKTQAVSEKEKALEARDAALTQQAEAVKTLSEERVQLAVVERQIKAFDAMDWAKVKEDEGFEAYVELRDQLRDLKDRRNELNSTVEQKTKDLDLDRQRSASEARAKAVEDCEAAVRRDIKGWNETVATKVGEFAVALGYTPKEVEQITDPRLIKALYAAQVASEALRRQNTKHKLETTDKTAPVDPPGGKAPGAARRTTDASGDQLSMAEWAKREEARLAAARAKR